MALNFLHHGYEGIRLAPIAIQNGGQFRRRGVNQGIAPVNLLFQRLCCA
jgi:hypothetical protein